MGRKDHMRVEISDKEAVPEAGVLREHGMPGELVPIAGA